jgi:hypothetical protein
MKGFDARSGVKTLRSVLGVLLLDCCRYLKAIWGTREEYLAICNRDEEIERNINGPGYRCKWQYTSDLHAPKIIPFLGKMLIRSNLANHQIWRLARPTRETHNPDISFIIGHRGLEKLPQLIATLESIAGQDEVTLECLVIEQDHNPCLPGNIPSWVRYLNATPPIMNLPYCRSWAFNIGFCHAKGSVLILHDNDILVPFDYAASVLRHIREGFEVVNLKRFIFFLSQVHSQELLAGQTRLISRAPEYIMQNSEAGGSVAITSAAYQSIGGFDEGFIGWGGEDNEFWERAQCLKFWPYGYLPLVHLWHPNQPGKYQPDNPTLLRYSQLSEIPVHERIARLRKLSQGQMSGPQIGTLTRELA